MKNIKNIFFFVILISLLILSGCGSENETSFQQSSIHEKSETSSEILPSSNEKNSNPTVSKRKNNNTEEKSEPSETDNSISEIIEESAVSIEESQITVPESSKESSFPIEEPEPTVLEISTVESPGTVSYAESSYTVEETSVIHQTEPSFDDTESYSSINEITSPEPQQYASYPENSEQPFLPDKNIVNVFQCYTSSAVYRDIYKLCDKYPDIISRFNIGQSAANKPIPCIMLGKGEKTGCIVAGIHSREHITISFTMKCIEEYAEAYTNEVDYGKYDIRKLLDEYTLYFIPMCNPDGTDISNAGNKPLIEIENFEPDSYKLNANGVNLNRNFPYLWEQQYSNSTFKPGDEKYPGKCAASENETQAIMNLCTHSNFEWLLDMHIVGNGIYWRDKLNRPIEGDYDFASAIAESGGYKVFDISSNLLGYSGGLENWFRYAYGKPALCIEMVPYYQSDRSSTYRALNSYFYEAVNWEQSKYTYLEAIACTMSND